MRLALAAGGLVTCCALATGCGDRQTLKALEKLQPQLVSQFGVPITLFVSFDSAMAIGVDVGGDAKLTGQQQLQLAVRIAKAAYASYELRSAVKSVSVRLTSVKSFGPITKTTVLGVYTWQSAELANASTLARPPSSGARPDSYLVYSPRIRRIPRN
jgi:hypothetical protein